MLKSILNTEQCGKFKSESFWLRRERFEKSRHFSQTVGGKDFFNTSLFFVLAIKFISILLRKHFQMVQAHIGLDNQSLKIKKTKLSPLSPNKPQTSGETSIPKEFKTFIEKNQLRHPWLYYSVVDNKGGNFCFLCKEYKQTLNIVLTQGQKTFIDVPSINLKTSVPHDHTQAKFINKLLNGSMELNFKKDQFMKFLKVISLKF